MEKLTLSKAKEIISNEIKQEHLLLHSANVSVAMEAMAKYFNEDCEHWSAIGYLHDFDYEKYPNEHLQHTEIPLKAMGISTDDIRCILCHGYTIRNDIEPITNMEKSLFTVDELTGIIQATARMRPNGIEDMEISSFMKKWKDKKFAAKCNRDIILRGCELLNMDIKDVASIVIEGMKKHKEELKLTVNK